jgi:hypothetical protein
MTFVLLISAVLLRSSGGVVEERFADGPPAGRHRAPALTCVPFSKMRSATGYVIGTPLHRVAVAARNLHPLLADVQDIESPASEDGQRFDRLPRWFPYLIIVAVCVVAVLAILGYIAQLFLLVLIMDMLTALEDFLAEIGMPKPKPIPLEYEQIGEVIVVTLRDNIATIRQCQTVRRQLKRLINEHHCDFVLDFLWAGKIPKSFRAVMLRCMKAARREAEKLGKPYRTFALPRGGVFRVFANRERAVEEMSKYDGHGWVVLCSVPAGIRAVCEST